MSVARAADFASDLIHQGVDFRSAVNRATQRYHDASWRDIQRELTWRSAQMRAPAQPEPEPEPEIQPEPEQEPPEVQGGFGFMDESRMVIRRMLSEQTGSGGGGAGGAGGAAGGTGGSGGTSGATGGTNGGTGNGNGSDGGGGTNMDGGDGQPGSDTMKTVHLGHRHGVGSHPYWQKRQCKHGRRKDGKCKKK